jgi:hypothetical protein
MLAQAVVLHAPSTTLRVVPLHRYAPRGRIR